MEFSLKLSDALAQLPEQPRPDSLGVMVPSIFLIRLEHEKIKSISCPKCSGRSLEETMRGSLNPREDLDCPITAPAVTSITSVARRVIIHLR
jgi:hypothetical protein